MQKNSQRHTSLVVAILVGAAFIAALDLFVVNVAFDDIGKSFHVGSSGGPTASDLSWILNAYAVFYAALLVPFGRLADRYGRRNFFLAGLIVFAIASLACALSPGILALVAFRALQAMGAAAMTPTSLSLLLAALPAERRANGVRLWAATGAVAAAVGPTVGGLLSEISWHWIFFINVPLALLLAYLAKRHVRDVPHNHAALRPDLLGAGVFAIAIGLLALGLVKSPDWGWGDSRTLASLAGSVIAGAIFWYGSSRHDSPVIDPALLRVRSFLFANVTMVLFNLSFAASLLLGILWMQQIWGYSVGRTGVASAAGPLMVPVTMTVLHRYFPTVSPHRLIALGAVVAAAGTGYLALNMGSGPNYVTGFLPGTLLVGIGYGLNQPNLLATATHDLPAHQSATGSGIITMARQIGYVIGISMLFAIAGSRHGAAAKDAYLHTWWVTAALLLAATATSLAMVSRRAPKHVGATEMA